MDSLIDENQVSSFIHFGTRADRFADKILRKVTRRFLFLFNDLIIITIKKDGAEMYEAQQVFNYYC